VIVSLDGGVRGGMEGKFADTVMGKFGGFGKIIDKTRKRQKCATEQFGLFNVIRRRDSSVSMKTMGWTIDESGFVSCWRKYFHFLHCFKTSSET
jgi:hypothetical protein